jgi:hypothetical protein
VLRSAFQLIWQNQGLSNMAGETKQSETVALIPDALWSKFSRRIKAGITTEYVNLPPVPGVEADEDSDWMQAFLIYTRAMERAQQGRSSWLRENITGLMVISAFMALAFGILGAWGISVGGATKEATNGFLDIAKLFSGALVGAAGATAVAKR